MRVESTPAPGRSTIASINPMSGDVVRELRAATPEEVREAVARARSAYPAWTALGAAGRAARMAEVRHLIFERSEDLVDVITSENGKPRAEALTHDILPTLLTLRYLEHFAPKALRDQRVGRLIGPVFGMSSRIQWRPYGVVGCISPWNYPLFLAFMAITPALLAGNAVVVKPSEVTPGVGQMIAELLAPLPKDVAIVVQGAGDVGAALVDAPCDKLCLIGSAATGRKIAASAAAHLTPTVMELGGQDAAIVCEDADLDVATSGILWGSFLNAGQTCCAIERVYVAASVADEFERLVVDKLGRIPTGRADADIGPLTVGRQRDVVARHVADAVERGARVLAGGPEARDGGPPGSLWYPPTVLEGRPEDAAMFGEETFGPVLPVVRVADDDEAVRRANQDGFNLTASVWTRNRDRGRALSDRLRAGSVTINDHGLTAGAPWGLWGGVGESGYGRLHGEVGLREFCVPVHVATNLTPRMKRLWWYPYTEDTMAALRGVAGALSAPTFLGRAKAALGAIRRVPRVLRQKL